MNRKTFLALTSALSTSAFLPKVSASSSKRKRTMNKNVVLITSDLGWMPKNFFGGMYLDHFSDFKEESTQFVGLTQPALKRGHRSTHAIFTGLRFEDRLNHPGEFVSLDQAMVSQVKRDTRWPFLYLRAGYGQNVVWNDQAQSIVPVDHPEKLFKMAYEKEDIALRERELKEQKLAIDTIANQVRRKAGSRKESKLMAQRYVEMSEELKSQMQWLKVAKPKTAKKASSYKRLDPFIDMGASLDLIADLLVQDQVKICTFQVGGSSNRIPLDGVHMGYHMLTHHQFNKDRVEQLSKIEGHCMQAISAFLHRLKREKLLDETIVLLTTGLGDANSHSNLNLPCMVFGGGLNHRGSFSCTQNGELIHPLGDLYNTILKYCKLNTKPYSGVEQVIPELLS